MAASCAADGAPFVWIITLMVSDELADEARLGESFETLARCALPALGAAKLASGAIEALTMATIINKAIRRDMANLLRTAFVDFGLVMPLPYFNACATAENVDSI